MFNIDRFKKDLETVVYNLSLISHNISDAREILSSQYEDLANLMLLAAADDVSQGVLIRDAIVSRFSEAISAFDKKSDRAIVQNKKFISFGAQADNEQGYIKLCEIMLGLFEKYFGMAFSVSDFVETDAEELPNYATGLVSYFKNIYADMAYEEFSKHIDSPRAAYQNDFSSVCEFLYSGECEYAILPFENSSDGLLTSFYSLITRYELKIVRQCTVVQADGQNETKFVLLKKKLPLDDMSGGVRCAEIFVSPDVENSISAVVSAIDCIGGEILRFNAVRRPYDGAYNYSVAFMCKKEQMELLMLYLTVRNVQYNLLGFYFCS